MGLPVRTAEFHGQGWCLTGGRPLGQQNGLAVPDRSCLGNLLFSHSAGRAQLVLEHRPEWGHSDLIRKGRCWGGWTPLHEPQKPRSVESPAQGDSGGHPISTSTTERVSINSPLEVKGCPLTTPLGVLVVVHMGWAFSGCSTSLEHLTAWFGSLCMLALQT